MACSRPIRHPDESLTATLGVRAIEIGSNRAAKKALKDLPSLVEWTAEDDPSDAARSVDDPIQRAMFKASFKEGMAQGASEYVK